MSKRDKLYAKIKELEVKRLLEFYPDKKIKITHEIDDVYDELDRTKCPILFPEDIDADHKE